MHGLKVGRAVIAFLLMTIAYIGTLLWVDQGKGLFSGIHRLYSVLPTLVLISLLSYLARYVRWHWLLARAGVSIRPLRGFVAYLAGFAFTATPGKVGELLRIRYFQPMGAPPALVLSTFVYERVFDLIVVLCLAGMAASDFGIFPLVLVFVLLILSTVFLLARYPGWLLHMARYLERRQMGRLARLADLFARGFAHTKVWITPLDVLVSLVTGLVAWALTAYVFVLLLDHLGLDVPALLAFSLYPVAMLAGAASMLPGGIGSTEAVLILLLAGLGVGLVNGTIAAIGVRLATLWFATLLGLISILILESILKPDGKSTGPSLGTR